MKIVRLREGKERSLLRRHPWVFAGSVDKGGGDSGETVRVQAADGRFLAWAAYSPRSQIRLRAWSYDEQQRIDEAYFAHRVGAAVALRTTATLPPETARFEVPVASGVGSPAPTVPPDASWTR